MRSNADIEKAIALHGTSVWRACLVYFSSRSDAEDAYQDVFLKYALADSQLFSSDEHRKAWLLRVASNVCKDMLKRAERKNEALDTCDSVVFEPAQTDPYVQPASETSMVLDAMRKLEDPPRTPLYLALVEGYSAPEIAKFMNAPVNTVYSWIARGKAKLKEALQ